MATRTDLGTPTVSAYLAGYPNAPCLEAQQAANVYAGTTQMELLIALNCRYYGVWYWPIPATMVRA